MEKGSTISYKVYSNERLKKVIFHGKEMYPLYIQVIYDRKPIYFKSYFFNLLSQEKYALHYIGGKKNPTQKDVISKEEKVLHFITDRNNENLSIDTLQKHYYYYSKDLLTQLDDSFKNYLVTFFEDQGQPYIAMMVRSAGELITSANIIHGFKSALKPALFKTLLENALYYATPYLPLKDFIEKKEREFFSTFSVYEWALYQAEFESFLRKDYPDYTFKDVQAYVKNLIEHNS